KESRCESEGFELEELVAENSFVGKKGHQGIVAQALSLAPPFPTTRVVAFQVRDTEASLQGIVKYQIFPVTDVQVGRLKAAGYNKRRSAAQPNYGLPANLSSALSAQQDGPFCKVWDPKPGAKVPRRPNINHGHSVAASESALDGILGRVCDSILPPGISINVSYSNTTDCPFPEDLKFILSRINVDSNVTDVETCGTTHLPQESMVVAHAGCFTSVSVFNASTKADVDAGTQAFVLKKLAGLLTCLPN
ncbi:acid phosphatase, partial [Moniliophthora roreri]